MKIVSLLSALCLASLVIYLSYRNRPVNTGEFSALDYREELSEFAAKGIYIDETHDTSEMLRQAEVIGTDIYGDGIKKSKPYNFYYDSENELFLLNGTISTLFGNHKGGIQQMIVNAETGEVLAIWHEK